ncbi:mammalian uncoordinated homology 13 protein [Tanacetum coccineum]
MILCSALSQHRLGRVFYGKIRGDFSYGGRVPRIPDTTPQPPDLHTLVVTYRATPLRTRTGPSLHLGGIWGTDQVEQVHIYIHKELASGCFDGGTLYPILLLRRGIEFAAGLPSFGALYAPVQTGEIVSSFAEASIVSRFKEPGVLYNTCGNDCTDATLISSDSQLVALFLIIVTNEFWGILAYRKNCDMGMRKFANSKNLVYTPTLPSGKSTIVSSGPGNSGCKPSGMPYSEVNSSRYSWEMVDTAFSSCIADEPCGPHSIIQAILSFLDKWVLLLRYGAQHTVSKVTRFQGRVLQTSSLDTRTRSPTNDSQYQVWNPRANQEGYAPSAVEVLRIIDETLDAFFQLPIPTHPALLPDLIVGLGRYFSNGLSNKFELTPGVCLEGIQQLCESTAYKIVFHDLSHSLWDGLYVGELSSSAMEPFPGT